MKVLRDNFVWACCNDVLDADIIEQYKDDFAESKIYVNCCVSSGLLLVSDGITVEASGNARVLATGNTTVIASDSAIVNALGNSFIKASGNATVFATGNARVEASGNTRVEASGNATVEASGNVSVKAWGNACIASFATLDCELSDNAIYRIREDNVIRYASDDLKFEKI